jgi:hypothetical protein
MRKLTEGEQKDNEVGQEAELGLETRGIHGGMRPRIRT